MSCSRRTHEQVVAVVTTIKEDDHQPKAYLARGGCQNAMPHGLQFDDAPKTSAQSRLPDAQCRDLGHADRRFRLWPYPPLSQAAYAVGSPNDRARFAYRRPSVGFPKMKAQ